MVELTLIRHAKSSWRLAGLDDASRPLNLRGLGDCLEMPERVSARVPAPAALLTSSAARTVQTAAAVANGWGLAGEAVHVDERLYLAGAQDMLAICAEPRWRSLSHLALVGHNPGMTDLYNRLASEPVDNVPTFGVAHFTLDAGWEDLAAGRLRRAFRSVDFFTPRTP